ncbi:hypothetical protein ACMGDK_18565 [Chryseobacterium sp. DT-3]|uniref:hypothetical protein n=1 Tax=Chryseobacterium sp. DT-3 TaxID=3396164 RepID=UPI003F193801
MKNYKKTGWIEEMQDQLDEKFSKKLYHVGFVFLLYEVLGFTSFKENKIVDNPRQEI